MKAREASQLFVVKYAVGLAFRLLAKKSRFLFTGPIGWVLSTFAEMFLGFAIAQKILFIDLRRMSQQVNLEEKEYIDAIKKAYFEANKEALTDEEKDRLRQLVIDATRRFVRVRTRG